MVFTFFKLCRIKINTDFQKGSIKLNATDPDFDANIHG